MWHDLKLETLSNWLEEMMYARRSAPPIFRLANVNELLDWTRRKPPQILKGINADVWRRQDSGILELRMNRLPDVSAKLFAEPEVQTLIEVAEAEDRRIFPRISDFQSDVILAEFRSWLAEDVDLDVIGPGGRVIVYASPKWVEANVIVRRRSKAIRSEWRPFPDLIEAVRTRILRKVSQQHELRIMAALGYFELSKYEHQSWLRPAFAFSLQYRFRENPALAWQETIVEAATTIPDVSVAEGLGSWAE